MPTSRRQIEIVVWEEPGYPAKFFDSDHSSGIHTTDDKIQIHLAADDVDTLRQILGEHHGNS